MWLLLRCSFLFCLSIVPEPWLYNWWVRSAGFAVPGHHKPDIVPDTRKYCHEYDYLLTPTVQSCSAFFSKRGTLTNFPKQNWEVAWCELTENPWFQSWWFMINKWPAWKITQESSSRIDGGASEGSQLFVGKKKNGRPDMHNLVTKSMQSGNQTTFYFRWQLFNTYWTTKINSLHQIWSSFSHVMIFFLAFSYDRSWVRGDHES